jgi:hypothetical protein
LEAKANSIENERCLGKEVLYGDTIQVPKKFEFEKLAKFISRFACKQLQHVASGQFVAVISRERAEQERHHVRMALDQYGHDGCWLQITPAYHSREIGQPVRSLSRPSLRRANPTRHRF